MPAIAMQTKRVPGSEVQIGTYLAYLDRPFVVVAIEHDEDHPTLGPRRIARDKAGRGVALYADVDVTVVR